MIIQFNWQKYYATVLVIYFLVVKLLPLLQLNWKFLDWLCQQCIHIKAVKPIIKEQEQWNDDEDALGNLILNFISSIVMNLNGVCQQNIQRDGSKVFFFNCLHVG